MEQDGLAHKKGERGIGLSAMVKNQMPKIRTCAAGSDPVRIRLVKLLVGRDSALRISEFFLKGG